METKSVPYQIEPNTSASYKRHQKQRFWQIIAPVIMGGLLLIAIAVLIILGVGGSSVGDVSQWADLSLIWLSLPVLLLVLIATLVLFTMVYLLARLLKILPGYTRIANQYAGMIESQAKIWMNKIVNPIISIHLFITIS